MRNDSEVNEKWYSIDRTADIYPLSITKNTQSIFRISAELQEYVDGENLSAALEAILPRFPTFAVQMRKGLFRYYFDQNNLKPVVRPDDGLLFKKIDFLANNRYLFRVTYYKKRISVDYFHALSDATGAMEFLKSLIYRYFEECGAALPPHGSVKIAGEEVPEAELKDSLADYYHDYRLFGGIIDKMAGPACVQITGKFFKALGYGMIQGFIKTEELLALSKKYGCTVTALVSALAMLVVGELYMKDGDPKNLVAVIPINLRKTLPSETLRNFTTIAKCPISSCVPRTLPDYINEIKKELAKTVSDKDGLIEKVSFSALYSAKWYMKMLPVGIKTFLTKAGKTLARRTKQTMIISNYGVVNMPEGMEKFVKRFSMNVNVSRKMPLNIGVVSYGGVTAISMTRGIVSTEFERRFFSRLAREGLEVEIVSNLREIKN